MRTPPLNWSLPAVCLIGCLVVSAVAGGVVAADESYDLTVTDAVEVPTQTVSHDDLNKDHEIDAFAVRDPGEQLTVSATVPAGESFDVELYNSGQQLEASERIEGSETVTFDSSVTNALAPGTYSLRLNEIGGVIQALHPVVISGYDVAISHPGEVERDGTLDVEIDVTPTVLEDDPADVEVVLWNDSETITEPASGSDGEYSAAVDLDGLDVGEYDIYVTAHGEEEFRGQQEILDLSEGETVEIVEGESETGNGDGNGDVSPPGNGGSNDDEQLPDESDPVDNGTDAEPGTDDGNETDETSQEPTALVEIVDEAPEEPGTQLSFENTTVRTLTLANESATGNVTVTERSTLPAEASSPMGTPLTTVEITVPETERNASAMLEFSVDADAVTVAEELVVERYISANDTWMQLETVVAEESGESITVTAETPGFSVFAVTEGDTESTSSEPSSNQSSTESESESGSETESESTPIMPTEPEEPSNPEDQPGFGVLAAIGALVFAVFGRVVQRSRDGSI